MPDYLADINIVHPMLLTSVAVLSIAAIVYLYFKRRTLGWLLLAAITFVAGAVLGLALVWVVVDLLDAFGGPVNDATWMLVPAACAGIGLALINLWGSRWWRKVIAILAVLLFGVTAWLGVNAAYGLNTTLGAAFGIVVANPIDLGDKPPASEDPHEPLYESWKPPADMPAMGTVGTQVIPNTASGFTSRPAGVYLPPAARVKNPPALPVVIMLMGQPGNPDPSFAASVLDKMAAQNNGLAPIVIVPDQLGDPSVDPLCLDTAQYGKAETFITVDVVNWVKENLHVLQGRQYWTISGYSNGGGCAAYFGAKYPQIFGNMGVFSAIEFAGVENEAATLATIFGGNQAEYDAVKPVSIFAVNPGKYDDTVGIFTAGSDDPSYVVSTKLLADAAQAAGVTVTFYEVPGGDHGSQSVIGGIQKMFEVLYPRLGLSQP